MENKTGNFEVHTMSELVGDRISSDENANMDVQGIQFLEKKPILEKKLSAPVVGSDDLVEDNLDVIKSKSKKGSGLFIYIFLVLAVSGFAVAGYIYRDKLTFLSFLNKEETEIIDDNNFDEEIESVEENEDMEDDDIAQEDLESQKVRFSENLSNYLMIDITDGNVSENIQKELDLIKLNLPEQNFSKPISFIVTDKNSKPILFREFSSYSEMLLSEDILNSLDEKFEVYAYHDFSSGVRFGLRVDVKNKVALEKALTENEKNLPSNFSVFSKEFTVNSANLNDFDNSEYNDYKIRFLNLNDQKTYSVDYVTTENDFIVGTTKKTIRAILDKLDKNKPEKVEKTTELIEGIETFEGSSEVVKTDKSEDLIY